MSRRYDGAYLAGKLGDAAIAARLAFEGRTSSAAIVGDGAAVVSLTSYGRRLRTVHLAIESIGRGLVRPGRLILWVADRGFVQDPPKAIKRLQARGLEVRFSPDYGPHKKYAEAVRTVIPREQIPLVLGDDDVMYPAAWLKVILEASRRDGNAVHGSRAWQIQVDRDGLIAPYEDWSLATESNPGFDKLATGAGGVLYSVQAAEAIADRGNQFEAIAPRADDIWLHHTMVRAGIQIAQCQSAPLDLTIIPNTQSNALWRTNVSDGSNTRLIASLYSEADRAKIREGLLQR